MSEAEYGILGWLVRGVLDKYDVPIWGRVLIMVAIFAAIAVSGALIVKYG